MPADDMDGRQVPPVSGDARAHPSLGGTLVLGAALTVIWCAVAAAYAVLGAGGRETEDGTIPAAFAVLVVVLPVALIWLSVVGAHSIRTLRSDIDRLQNTIAELKRAQRGAAAGGTTPAPPAARDAAAAVPAEGGAFASRRDKARTVPSADRSAPHTAPSMPAGRAAGRGEQPSLALGTPTEAMGDPLEPPDLIRALDFPESAEDRDGFRALRRALAHHETARLIRAAQDVLTLLSEEGLYMDDLVPDRARPEIWRRFADGERGRAVAALGGIRDRDALALVAARMRGDAVFRDAVHHFLRQFDRSLARFCADAEDAQIARLGDTRTARAFMLLGRAAGSFD